MMQERLYVKMSWIGFKRPEPSCILIIFRYPSPTQTLLEKLKHAYNPRYNPLPREKIAPTVGMNGMASQLRIMRTHTID